MELQFHFYQLGFEYHSNIDEVKPYVPLTLILLQLQSPSTFQKEMKNTNNSVIPFYYGSENIPPSRLFIIPSVPIFKNFRLIEFYSDSFKENLKQKFFYVKYGTSENESSHQSRPIIQRLR